MGSELDDAIKRLSGHKGVQGVVVANSDGIAIRSTLDAQLTAQYSALIAQLASKARSVVRDLDPQNDLCFLRILSRKHEIMVSPERDYLMFVIQTPQQSAGMSFSAGTSATNHSPLLNPTVAATAGGSFTNSTGGSGLMSTTSTTPSALQLPVSAGMMASSSGSSQLHSAAAANGAT